MGLELELVMVCIGDNLDVSISGSGSVFYKGNPTINTSIRWTVLN